jgi:hypothetical protein
MKLKLRLIALVATTLGMALAGAALALAGNEAGRLGPPPPPPEAYEACAGKAEGDAVQLTLPDGQQLQAVCMKAGDALAARPAHPPKGSPPPRPLV